MNKEGKRLLVSVTCYNNEQEVLEFAKMMDTCSGKHIPLVVNINSSNDIDTFINEIEKVKSNAFVFNPSENLGYLNGCLFGVKKYLEKENVDYVMITNTDITFNDVDFFKKLQTIEIDDDVWCIGPNVVRASNGAAQNPFMIGRPTQGKMYLYKTVYSNRFANSLFIGLVKLKRKILGREKAKATSKEIYASDGSCFVLKTECALKVSEVSSNIMMYGEEILVAEIVKMNGKKEWFIDSLNVIHHANTSTGKMNTKRVQKWYKDSFKWLYESYFK